MDMQTVAALRMERQHLNRRASEAEYPALFRDLQPGLNLYWHGFGEPPVLSFRADFDDTAFNRRRQLERKLVKGRFQGGNIGWVAIEDLELFAGLYRKPLKEMTPRQRVLMELLTREGPLNIQQMKELTGMLVKEITPALHRLQEAFLLYEDQYDGQWDRSWYRFEEMFPQADLERYTRADALKEVLPRFARRMVWFDADMAKNFYRLPKKDILAALSGLEAQGALAAADGGYLLAGDRELLEQSKRRPDRRTLVLHLNDPLVRAFEPLLKERYRSGEWEILQFILIDGEFHGAVQGKFKYGPYILENVAVDPGFEERKEEILKAVAEENGPSPVLRFNGSAV